MKVRVPYLGLSVDEATVATWFKKTGDFFVSSDVLCDLQTEKGIVPVLAYFPGTLGEVLCEEGETVTFGQELAHMSVDESFSIALKYSMLLRETGAGDPASATSASSRVARQERAAPYCETCRNIRRAANGVSTALRTEIAAAEETYLTYRKSEHRRIAKRSELETSLTRSESPPDRDEQNFHGTAPIKSISSELNRAGLSDGLRLEKEAAENETHAMAEAEASDTHELGSMPAVLEHCRPNSVEAHVNYLRNGAHPDFNKNDQICGDHVPRGGAGKCIDCAHYLLPRLLDVELCDELQQWRASRKHLQRLNKREKEIMALHFFNTPGTPSKHDVLSDLRQEKRLEQNTSKDIELDHRKLVAEYAVEEFKQALDQGGVLQHHPMALSSCQAWGPTAYALAIFFNPHGNCPRFEPF